MEYKLTTDQLAEKIAVLKAGDILELSGVIYTARDAAHKKLASIIAHKESLPINLKNSIIYYCGPCPRNQKRGDVIGSCGPTTSSRMDLYTPLLLSLGVRATIGKGPRSVSVIESMKANKSVYLIATGGAGALLSRKVKSSQVVAFPELGPEAVYKLEVVDFPLIVANDIYGKTVFFSGGANG